MTLPRRETKSGTPPRLAVWLFRRVLPREQREFILGDLEEKFLVRVQSAGSRRRAEGWYWAQVGRCLLSVLTRPPRPYAYPGRKGDNWMQSFWMDIRFAWRMMRKHPAFTATAVLTLALGIGANTAMFSIVNGVLLRSLPYTDAERLVLVYKDNPRRKSPSGASWVSAGDFQDWQEHNSVFENLAGYSPSRARALEFYNGENDPAPERVIGTRVSPNLFDVLGVSLLMGRTFTKEEQDIRNRGNRPIILGYSLWQRRYGGDPAIVGQRILAGFVGSVEPREYVVVGIAPKGFQFPPGGKFWTASLDLGQRFRYRNYTTLPIARLKDGITIERAQAEMAALAARLDEERSADDAYPVVVEGFFDHLTGKFRPMLLAFFAAIGFVLLIACANVANLVLARVTSREREVAVRAVLGADRMRLLRQLLTENLLLGLLGGAAGLLLGYTGVKMFLAYNPAEIPRVELIRLDGVVFLFTLGLSVATGLLFGLAPGWYSLRLDLNTSLKEGTGRQRRTGGRFFRQLLVVSETALALMLVVASGLMLNSFLRLAWIDAGFSPDRLLTADVIGHVAGMRLRGEDKQGELPGPKQHEILERILALAGVESAALVSQLPPEGRGRDVALGVEGEAVDPALEAVNVGLLTVTPGYFETMQIPLRAGRVFTIYDIVSGLPVVMVNEMLARRFAGGEQALGKRVLVAGEVREIIGIVSDTLQAGLDQGADPILYWPTIGGYYTADGTFFAPGKYLVVRTGGEPEQFFDTVENVIRETAISSARPIVSSLDRALWVSMAQPRFHTLLFGTFGAIGLLLASVGIYGVVSFLVTQRTHEMGVRMALGAQRGEILKMVVRQGMTQALLGVALGLAGALALMRYMESLLFGITTSDLLTYVVFSTVLLTAALLACVLPARRAMRINPITALRYE